MKKLFCLMIILVLTSSAFAGDIPNSYLVEDDAQVYFGEIKEFTNNTVTIIQKEKIKGEFRQDSEHTYERKDFTTLKELETGKIYLCTVIPTETYIHIAIWNITSTDTKTLKVIEDHTFAFEMQQALNKGSFEKAEQKRLAKIKELNNSDTSDTSVISGTEKPTDSFSKSDINAWLVVGAGSLTLTLIVLLYFIKKRK